VNAALPWPLASEQENCFASSSLPSSTEHRPHRSKQSICVLRLGALPAPDGLVVGSATGQRSLNFAVTGDFVRMTDDILIGHADYERDAG
jgi:hypothetical protein